MRFSASSDGGSALPANETTPAIPHTLRLLAGDKGGDVGDRFEVVGHHLAVLDLDAKLAFEKVDHLEHAGRVDDAVIEQRGVIGERAGIGDVEIAENELPDLVFDVHARFLATATLGSSLSLRTSAMS